MDGEVRRLDLEGAAPRGDRRPHVASCMLERPDRAQKLGPTGGLLDPTHGGDIPLEPLLRALPFALGKRVDAGEQLRTPRIQAPRPFVPGERFGALSDGLEQVPDLNARSRALADMLGVLGAQSQQANQHSPSAFGARQLPR